MKFIQVASVAAALFTIVAAGTNGLNDLTKRQTCEECTAACHTSCDSITPPGNDSCYSVCYNMSCVGGGRFGNGPCYTEPTKRQAQTCEECTATCAASSTPNICYNRTCVGGGRFGNGPCYTEPTKRQAQTCEECTATCAASASPGVCYNRSCVGGGRFGNGPCYTEPTKRQAQTCQECKDTCDASASPGVCYNKACVGGRFGKGPCYPGEEVV